MHIPTIFLVLPMRIGSSIITRKYDTKEDNPFVFCVSNDENSGTTCTLVIPSPRTEIERLSVTDDWDISFSVSESLIDFSTGSISIIAETTSIRFWKKRSVFKYKADHDYGKLNIFLRDLIDPSKGTYWENPEGDLANLFE